MTFLAFGLLPSLFIKHIDSRLKFVLPCAHANTICQTEKVKVMILIYIKLIFPLSPNVCFIKCIPYIFAQSCPCVHTFKSTYSRNLISNSLVDFGVLYIFCIYWFSEPEWYIINCQEVFLGQLWKKGEDYSEKADYSPVTDSKAIKPNSHIHIHAYIQILVLYKNLTHAYQMH